MAWDLRKTKEPPECVQKWTRGTGLWEKPELKTVLFALCHDFHFYLVAAILDQVRPKLLLLESLNLGVPPPQVAKIQALLEWHVKDLPLKPRRFTISCPLVPQQVPGSLNCGLHVCEMAERILAEPSYVARKAEEESLAFWFDPESMEDKRLALAKTMEDMAVEQRKPEGVLYGNLSAKPVLLKDPSTTKKEVAAIFATRVAEAKAQKKKERKVPKKKIKKGASSVNFSIPSECVGPTPNVQDEVVSRHEIGSPSDIETQGDGNFHPNKMTLRHVSDYDTDTIDNSPLKRGPSVVKALLSQLPKKTKNVSKNVSDKPPRKCGLCRQSGHNKKNCTYKLQSFL